MLSVLSVIALSIVGESGEQTNSSSWMCDVIDTDVWEVGCSVLFDVATSVWLVIHFFSVFDLVHCWLEIRGSSWW